MALVVAPPAAPAGDGFVAVSGAEVLFRPIDRKMLRRARRAAIAAIGGEAAEESEASAAEQLEELGDALSYALLVAGIADWRGVVIEVREGEAVTATNLDCTPENIALVLSDPLTFDAFDAAYVVPFATRERVRAAPGNGSAASPSGTGEVAMPAPDIASNRATRRRTAAAKPARTSPRKPRPKRKKASGAS